MKENFLEHSHKYQAICTGKIPLYKNSECKKSLKQNSINEIRRMYHEKIKQNQY
jgi:hypothetical protein